MDLRILRRAAVHGIVKSGRILRRRRRGVPGPPPFLFISLTNDCNLSCRGCWVTPTRPPTALPWDTLDRLIGDWQRQGAPVFGLLGGEPLLYPALEEVLARHPNAFFLVFTNGWLLDDRRAAAFRRLGNVTPLISFEGLGAAADERRGGAGVADRTWAAVDACRRHRLLTGVATSLCRTNLDDLASDRFLAELIRRGVHYVWYYLYRPVGPRPSPELALGAEDILCVRRFVVDARRRWPILIVDAYWDADGRPLCPAAAGLSHHIAPSGAIEPCPVIQFAVEDIGDGAGVPEKIAGSPFLAAARARLAEAGGGCILLKDPAALGEFLRSVGARDTSGRGTGYAELAALRPRPDHAVGPPIPERHWMYRWAKRRAFWGMGAYG